MSERLHKSLHCVITAINKIKNSLCTISKIQLEDIGSGCILKFSKLPNNCFYPCLLKSKCVGGGSKNVKCFYLSEAITN